MAVYGVRMDRVTREDVAPEAAFHEPESIEGGGEMKISAKLSLASLTACFILFPVFLTGFIFSSIAQDIGGRTHLLRSSTKMPDGRIKVGDLVVQEGKNGQEAKVKIMGFDSKGNGKEDWITMSELGRKPVGTSRLKFTGSWKPDNDKLYFGVSVDNKLLIVVKGTGNRLKVAKDRKGVYDIRYIDKKKIVLADGLRMPDGRIKVDGK